jgi:hypothetical protein
MDSPVNLCRGNQMAPTKLPKQKQNQQERQEPKKVEPLSPHYQQILKNIPIMPDTAAIPVPVAALHEGVSRRTIKRTYPLVKISDHREGVLLSYLRRKREIVAA